MTFAAPLFLMAALAAIIPVVLHLINRQQAKDLPFSTLRFLRISVEKTRRRRRIHDLLLMLLRMAVLLLIAVGLSKPALTSLNALLGGADSAVAIVLDNSASMGLIDQGTMRFDTAKRAALQILDELDDGDQIALWITGGPNFPEQGKLERTKEHASQLLEAVEVSFERANLALAVRDAQETLAQSEAPNKQIYVLSDMQAHAWEGLDESDAKSTDADADVTLTEAEQSIRDMPLIFVDCNRSPAPNVAISGIEPKAMVPVAGLPIKAVTELFNASPIEQQRHLELYIDGAKTASSPSLRISPQGRAQHEFDFTFERGGLHRCEVRLTGQDGSKFDDRRFFTMEVDQGIPVAIVKPQRHEIPYLEDTFYVEQALSPGPSGSWAITTTTLVASDLASEPLSNYTVIFCVNLPALNADSADRLARYVEAGGHIVWFGGERIVTEAYNAMNEQSGDRLLPAALLEIRQPAAGDERDSWNIGFLDKAHPALSHLVEPASLYQSVLVYKHLRMDVGEARVMARLDDGEPLIVSREIEQGSVTMIGTGAHVGWTNMPLRPIFLPLLARMAFELAGAEQARHHALAGSPLTVQFGEEIPPGTVEVVPPSGATIRRTTADESGKRRKEFRYAETHQIGIYLMRLLEAVRPTTLVYSVNVDPDESSPEKIDPAALEKSYGVIPLVHAEDPDDLSSTFAWLREGESLWGLFLTCVLIALVFETFLSNRLTPKQETPDQQKPPPGMRRLAKKGRAA